MSFKISKTKLALYVSTLLIFLPVSDLFYGNPLIKIAVNINYAYILGFIAIMVASKQMRIFGKSKILMLFFLVMTISTLVNSGIDIDKFISLLKMAIIILFIAAQWERNSQELISTVENVLLMLVFANFISLCYIQMVYTNISCQTNGEVVRSISNGYWNRRIRFRTIASFYWLSRRLGVPHLK